jgi:membrane-bound ClpP family serine protease
MNLISRTITGISMISLGLFLIVLSFFTSFIPLFYGIPILIFGVIIFFNKNEDKIEEIKKIKMKGGKNE